ncbi:hypothetical protein OUZ56_018832 [Daphnia magna]|uniref:Uncharacterized protein n=1 Tax=Daphnia magna TaxID=35525 RepID=A0ABQ9Z9Y4_9CRUS|nr:hypothetical protein OUZ56_018832 [Daphnia magna]
MGRGFEPGRRSKKNIPSHLTVGQKNNPGRVMSRCGFTGIGFFEKYYLSFTLQFITEAAIRSKI